MLDFVGCIPKTTTIDKVPCSLLIARQYLMALCINLRSIVFWTSTRTGGKETVTSMEANNTPGHRPLGHSVDRFAYWRQTSGPVLLKHYVRLYVTLKEQVAGSYLVQH